MLFKSFLSALLVASATTAGYAQVSTFFGDSNAFPRDLTVPNQASANFHASFASSGTDNLESYTPGTTPAIYNIAGVGVDYTSTFAFVNANQGGFNLSVSGINFAFGLGNPFTGEISPFNSLVFNRQVNGFGMYFVNVGDTFANSFTVTLQDGAAGTPRVVPINANSDGSGSPLNFSGRNGDATFFFGVRDTEFFDRVTITASSNQDGIVFDDVSVGFIAAVPEPTTYALMGCIIAGAGGWYARKRKLQKQLEGKKFSRQ